MTSKELEENAFIKAIEQSGHPIPPIWYLMRETMISPCINVCLIISDVCGGCGRTLEQIARWRCMTDEERLKIMTELEKKS